MQKRSGADPGAAGQRLAFDPALVGAENETVRREDLGEVCICALGAEGIVPPKSRTEGHDIDFFDIRDKDHGVWDTSVKEVNLMRGIAQSERLPSAIILRASHFNGDQLALQSGRDESSLCFKTHGKWFLWHETRSEPCKATGSITAHLGLAAVAIVVAHAEISSPVSRLDGQQSIRTNSSVPVTEAGYGRAVE
jgi:hypothetical protein